MRWVIGLPFACAVIALAIGALTGRVRARSCCAIADPSQDLRMRSAAPLTPPGAPHAHG